MTAPRHSYSCGCFYTDNIFIQEFHVHVRYTGELQFRRDYERLLSSRGCRTSEQFRNVLEMIKVEVERRRKLGEESLHRRTEISLHYKPLYPEVYLLQESFLAAEFLAAVRYSKSPQANIEGLLHHLHSIPDRRQTIGTAGSYEEHGSSLFPHLLIYHGTCFTSADDIFKHTPDLEYMSEWSPNKRIYRLPVFIPEFCAKLVEELENFERSDLPKGRPNTMNNYGILLNELGFVDELTAPLCEKYIQPLTSLLYPDWGGGCLDSHRAFVVKYALQEDLDLSCHYDNAEVTLNISLGKEFIDGNLYFSDMKEVPVNERTYVEVEHVTGQGILHRGQHVHGALPITSGERWNLILWMRASHVRNKRCPMCDREPVLVKTLGDGDGFTSVGEERERMVDVCTLT